MLGLLALAVVLALALRNGLAIPVRAPLDPNEGWNATHALRLLAGGPLYPTPTSLMVNNYPPLSFYLVAALTRITSDAVVAGRIIASLAFAGVCGGIFCAARRLGADTRSAGLGALFFACMVLIASDYAGIDDPQMLGHAVQIGALLLVLRGRVTVAAALFAASLFVKHSLLALPLACGLWLTAQDRRDGLRFVAAGAAFAVIGLVLLQLAFGISLWSQVTAPRQSALTNAIAAVSHLWWTLLPALAARRAPALSRIYAVAALLLGLAFAAGDGVDANIFFDLAIALSLMLAFAPPTLSAAAPLPLLAFLAWHWNDNNFFFTDDFRDESRRDIAFMRDRSGPSLCSQASLCLWAGKSVDVDVFNLGEAIKAGARKPDPLIRLIEARSFAVIQFDDTDALGPEVKAAIAKNYRADHRNDNGVWFVPVRR
jgi:hypothetical protein